MEQVRFEQDDVANVLGKLRQEQIDQLSFGAIQVDHLGNILYYSAMEGQITGRNPDEVVGKNFFSDVAPCTHRPEFYDRFIHGVRDDNLNVMFEYVFDYNMQPIKVKVHMKKALDGKTYWILVKRL